MDTVQNTTTHKTDQPYFLQFWNMKHLFDEQQFVEILIFMYVSLLILDGLVNLVLHKAVATALCFQVLAMNH